MRRRFQDGGQTDTSGFGDAFQNTGFAPPLISHTEPFGGETDVQPLWSPPTDWGNIGSEVGDALHSAAVATGA